MNVVFWLIVIVGIVFLWFSLSFLFKGVGDFLISLFQDAKDGMSEENDNQEKEN